MDQAALDCGIYRIMNAKRDGDFLSLCRYKEGVYALLDEGEEVKLRWANADQYYIESGQFAGAGKPGRAK